MSSESSRTELERLQAAGIAMMREGRPAVPPLLFVMKPVVDWAEARLIAILRETGFAQARPAFNPVFVHLPADGCRLTELAARAGMSKQAMAEVVEELIALGYVARFPDPSDGRAKVLVRTDAGLALHGRALEAFARIDGELAALIGHEAMARLRAAAEDAAAALREG